MRIADDRWAKILQAMTLKALENGINLGEPNKLLEFLQEELLFLIDEGAVTAYIDAQELVNLRVKRIQRQESLDIIDAEIARLETSVSLKNRS